ncbi:DUF4344 domain-containing metallopeptidase [Vibrio brasiliensis]|jgi:hypothetical protein|uniref:Metallopeptidase DUF4344 n=1 Tax=Vibrio brasiliensis LMG 20546 TaxID=945543 RepID=E8LWY8_9VIBR|nr:DUF4344 domain-containing metallopeptidase [Vibrio brasiliensis]EGA64889.1 hypothetical protein VIBR0546_17703 [Vibrio brasiliensis LMG 20546]MCG9649342.1 DUF4344 domain-containing metallopeptidase [Vibrio brasiliensis]MCG9725134.1 DUF4344 domain-containing metallopeptidase [Vibrio brasiliensis]MCG9749521.1 DUF4344 domain-containing metallopeptidase [Vibrio brasiliensis]MCG9782584.1 DUF4344 domain-containing metallopeptidase [Vibrio brasiliensis]
MFLRVLLPSLLLSASAFADSDSVVIRYLEPQNQVEKTAKSDIEQSGVNQTLVDLSESLFPFRKTLTIEYGGDQGPLYDPELHQVQMPYEFYQQALDYFKKNEYDKKYGKSAQAGAIDTVLHTLLHEAGHAYIADQNIPILGKEEDAVDNFAALMMIEYVENGEDAAISAADMFAFESEDRPDYYDFGEYIDEHSFDLQRYFSTLCLVYGSNPEKHKGLLDEVENDYLADRKDFCIYQYQTVAQNWHSYLNVETTDQ